MSEKIKISRKNLECSYLFLIYVFWKGVQTFHLKNSENLGFLCYFVKAKTKKCNKKNLSFLDQFRMLKFAFDTCFLKVNVHASLKVATKGSFRCKKILIFTTVNTKHGTVNLVFIIDERPIFKKYIAQLKQKLNRTNDPLIKKKHHV